MSRLWFLYGHSQEGLAAKKSHTVTDRKKRTVAITVSPESRHLGGHVERQFLAGGSHVAKEIDVLEVSVADPRQIAID